jgi:hypothetical protein
MVQGSSYFPANMNMRPLSLKESDCKQPSHLPSQECAWWARKQHRHSRYGGLLEPAGLGQGWKNLPFERSSRSKGPAFMWRGVAEFLNAYAVVNILRFRWGAPEGNLREPNMIFTQRQDFSSKAWWGLVSMQMWRSPIIASAMENLKITHCVLNFWEIWSWVWFDSPSQQAWFSIEQENFQKWTLRVRSSNGHCS